MSTKTISISEDAYEVLASWKQENESFSDVIRRLGRRMPLSTYAKSISEKRARELKEAVRSSRERSRQRYA